MLNFRRILLGGALAATVTVSVAASAATLAPTVGDHVVVTGVALLATAGGAWVGVATALRARADSNATMAAVVTLTRWVLATQRELQAVRKCGDNIEATLGRLDERMTASSLTGRGMTAVRAPIIDLSPYAVGDRSSPAEAHG